MHTGYCTQQNSSTVITNYRTGPDTKRVRYCTCVLSDDGSARELTPPGHLVHVYIVHGRQITNLRARRSLYYIARPPRCGPQSHSAAAGERHAKALQLQTKCVVFREGGVISPKSHIVTPGMYLLQLEEWLP